jgi:metal-responsive CopG/Arc/MetJ family transcriptional regulator
VVQPRTDNEFEKTPRVPITFPEALYERLREASYRRRIPMSEIVREALREYLDRTEPQMRLPIEGGGSR